MTPKHKLPKFPFQDDYMGRLCDALLTPGLRGYLKLRAIDKAIDKAVATLARKM